MDQRANNELAEAGLSATGALSCPTDATGSADVRAESVDVGCGESSQPNLETESRKREENLLSLFNRHVQTLANEFPEVYAQLLEAFLQEVFRMDDPASPST